MSRFFKTWASGARGFPRWKRSSGNSASLTRGAEISTVERVEGKQRERHAGRGVLRRLIRAFARTPALANAGAKLPWHREAARPKPALVLFGLSLCFGICVLAVSWPIERKPIAHEPIREIDVVDGANGDAAVIAIPLHLDA